MKKVITVSNDTNDQDIERVFPGFVEMAQKADAMKRIVTANGGLARNRDIHPDVANLSSRTKSADKRFGVKMGLTPLQAKRYAEVLFWATFAA